MSVDDTTLRALVRELPVVTPPADAKVRLLATARAVREHDRARARRVRWVVGAAAAAAVVVAVPVASAWRERRGAAEEEGAPSVAVVSPASGPVGEPVLAPALAPGLAPRSAPAVAPALAPSPPSSPLPVVAASPVARAHPARALGAPSPAVLRLVSGASAERERTVRGGRVREVVRVRDATLRLEVPPLTAETWVVASADAEVECKAGVFTAVATGGRLSHVDVISGEVVVRRDGRAPVVLGPGEQMTWSWSDETEALGGEAYLQNIEETSVGSEIAAAPQATDTVVESAPRVRTPVGRPRGEPGGPRLPPVAAARPSPPSRAPVGQPRAPTVGRAATPADAPPFELEIPAPALRPREPDDGQRHPVLPDPWDGVSPTTVAPELDVALEARFLEGWKALKKGADEAAAVAFGDVVEHGGTSALAEEAAYHQVLALVRAGALGRAEVVVRRQILRWPQGKRTGPSALLLGEQLRGEQARPWLERAERDLDGETRERARVALKKL